MVCFLIIWVIMLGCLLVCVFEGLGLENDYVVGFLYDVLDYVYCVWCDVVGVCVCCQWVCVGVGCFVDGVIGCGVQCFDCWCDVCFDVC